MQLQIKRAVTMAKEVGHLFLATADASGSPHIAIVKDIGAGPGDSVLLTMWPCQCTFAHNRQTHTVTLEALLVDSRLSLDPGRLIPDVDKCVSLDRINAFNIPPRILH